jgi:hypothetical protein
MDRFSPFPVKNLSEPEAFHILMMARATACGVHGQRSTSFGLLQISLLIDAISEICSAF